MKRAKKIILLLCAASLMSCGGEDYTPVYFPGGQARATDEVPPRGTDLDITQAHCELNLTAQLCVKIIGDNIEDGIDEPLCADTPAIPLLIEGERILLKGSDFPDIPVSVEIRGVATPMTINGRGETDGSQNIGEGSWTPQGDILIQGFSFYINVLGMSGEIPNMDLTTDEAKVLPQLPQIKGKPADAGGSITLVTGTVLGSLFPVADELLRGASLQAVFTGQLDPPLNECSQAAGERKIRVVKLRQVAGGAVTEEAIPEGNILEISQGTFIASGPTDVGPQFEATASFKAVNDGKEAIDIAMPTQAGPFYFFTQGRTHRDLAPQQSFRFDVTFRPDAETVPEAGSIKESFTLGRERFYLTGQALAPEGRSQVHQESAGGGRQASNVQSVAFGSLPVTAALRRRYFACEAQTCNGIAQQKNCAPCAPSQTTSCLLLTVDAEGRPIEEVNEDCTPRHPGSAPQMELNAAASRAASAVQTVAIENRGVAELVIQNIFLEEWPDSRSTGQFQLRRQSFNLPATLPVAQAGETAQTLPVAVAYAPTDLLGFDGAQAAPGRPVTDQAYLVVESNSGAQKILLTGKTQIEESAPLQVILGTATGFQTKTGGEPFTFQEVTQTTRDLAYPVFLNIGESVPGGMRISAFAITGEDANYFEWLDTQEAVSARTPAAGEGRRCSIPIFDPEDGRWIDERFDLPFVRMGSQGFDLKPGTAAEGSWPLFGCLNFHRDGAAETEPKRIFQAQLTIEGFPLDPQGRLVRNPDQTFRQMQMRIPLVAAIDPIAGNMVVRITQTTFAILNPSTPAVSGMAARNEIEAMVRAGGPPEESVVLLGSMVLDPFDTMEITDASERVASTPGDGVTGVFRQIDTRPSPVNYADPRRFDYATLLHDSTLGEPAGIFHDYDFPEAPLPEPLQVNAWRIFSGALSYPGPLSPRSPITRGECEVIDPCAPEGLRQFSESGIGADGKGACAFFFASGGHYQSGAFQPVIRGEPHNLCDDREQPQDLQAMNTGRYTVDGAMTFTDVGLRFWGPTYIHNPHGPLGPKPPLDEVFHIAFTTEVLKPPSSPNEPDVIPDVKIDRARMEYKINLTETEGAMPALCPKNTRNRRIGGRSYSSWRYLAQFLSEDEAGTIPAGCPEGGFSGGSAFLRGRRLDPETKTFTVVAAGKFGTREDLSLAFKNVSIFVLLHGWLCDPQGAVEDFEGPRCFDAELNDRDTAAQITMMEE